jgi:hypothetical protein
MANRNQIGLRTVAGWRGDSVFPALWTRYLSTLWIPALTKLKLTNSSEICPTSAEASLSYYRHSQLGLATLNREIACGKVLSYTFNPLPFYLLL